MEKCFFKQFLIMLILRKLGWLWRIPSARHSSLGACSVCALAAWCILSTTPKLRNFQAKLSAYTLYMYTQQWLCCILRHTQCMLQRLRRIISARRSGFAAYSVQTPVPPLCTAAPACTEYAPKRL